MNFKFKSLLFFALLGMVVSFSSCDDDDDGPLAAPVISDVEIGRDNNLTAQIGDELHVEAEIEAEARIAKIELELHNEEGSGDEFEEEFTEFAGQRNASFHEHLKIPADATPGEYHFHLKVLDEEGQETEVEADVMVVE